MPINVVMLLSLQVKTKKSKFVYKVYGVKHSRAQCTKDLNIKIVSNLKLFQQCIKTAHKSEFCDS